MTTFATFVTFARERGLARRSRDVLGSLGSLESSRILTFLYYIDPAGTSRIVTLLTSGYPALDPPVSVQLSPSRYSRAVLELTGTLAGGSSTSLVASLPQWTPVTGLEGGSHPRDGPGDHARS